MTSESRPSAGILYLVGLTPEPGYDEKFNEWYDTQHVPELLACPGFLSATRFELVEGLDSSPTYLASYEIAGIEAFESEEYLALQARGLDDLTPLARDVRQHRTREIWAKYRPLSTVTNKDDEVSK